MSARRGAAFAIDILRYRLYAQAIIPDDGSVEVAVVPVVGGAPYAPDSTPGIGLESTWDGAFAPVRESPGMSAAVRAVRERVWDKVQQQLAHFCRTTGRDWWIRRLEYGEPLPPEGPAETSPLRVMLITEVELGASVPTFH